MTAVAIALDRVGGGDLRSFYVRGPTGRLRTVETGIVDVADRHASLAMTKKGDLNEKTAINVVSLVN